MALKQHNSELFFLNIAEILEPALPNGPNRIIEPEPDLSLIPKEYHEFVDVFSKREAQQLPPHRSYDYRILLEEGATPPYGPIYSLSPEELKVLHEYIQKNLKSQWIRHSQSLCSAPVLFTKKTDGSLRLCVDYRGLNKLTVKNRYPLPLIGETLERISQGVYFTSMDLRDGFHLLRIAKGEEWKSAFRCRYRLFEYRVMPFGLCNGPGTFQHFTNDTFRDYLDDFLAIYLDDLLIYSKTLKEHKIHVRKVLERLRQAGLFVKSQKCQFHVQEVMFLGYKVSRNGIQMNSAKIEAIVS